MVSSYCHNSSYCRKGRHSSDIAAVESLETLTVRLLDRAVCLFLFR